MRRAAVLRRARSAAVRERYRDAWVLTDRPNEADDNGERLFEYLREHRPDINAWFAISAESPDYVRLRVDHGDRVVARGTRDFRLLMLNAAWLVSSHADRVVTRPASSTGSSSARRGGTHSCSTASPRTTCRSGSTRSRPTCSSSAPRRSSSRSPATGRRTGTPRKETRNTGLPRFDRLLRKARETDPCRTEPDPGRAHVAGVAHLAHRRRRRSSATSTPRFWTSEYLRNWTPILRSPADRRRGGRGAGLTLGFMPHPAMQPILPRLDLPRMSGR